SFAEAKSGCPLANRSLLAGERREEGGASCEPHSEQNFAEAGLPWPHAGQARGSGAPHSEQKFAASGTLALQLGQFIYASRTGPIQAATLTRLSQAIRLTFIGSAFVLCSRRVSVANSRKCVRPTQECEQAMSDKESLFLLLGKLAEKDGAAPRSMYCAARTVAPVFSPLRMRIRPIADQAAVLDVIAVRIGGGQLVTRRKADQRLAAKSRPTPHRHDHAALGGAREGGNRALDLAEIAHPDGRD